MNVVINFDQVYGRFGLERGAKLCKEAGFDAMDFSLGCMVDPNNVFNGDNYVEECERIRATAEAAGLPIHQTHTPFNFPKKQWADPEVFKNFIIPTIHRSVEVSARLGAKVAVVHPIHWMVYRGNEEYLFHLNMEFYRELIPICEKFNIKVGIENMYWGDARRPCYVFDTCGRSEEFIRYIDTLNSEYMVGCVDVGHTALPLMATEEAYDMIRALGHDRVKALHIHDNDYRSDAHKHPFFGLLNWDEITKALGEIDYDGDFTYEAGGFITSTMDDEFVPTALKYMADIGKHLCTLIDENRPAT